MRIGGAEFNSKPKKRKTMKLLSILNLMARVASLGLRCKEISLRQRSLDLREAQLDRREKQARVVLEPGLYDPSILGPRRILNDKADQ